MLDFLDHPIFKIFRGNLQRFRRLKLEISTPQTQKFGLKIFSRILKGSARHDEIRGSLHIRFSGMCNAEGAHRRIRRFLRGNFRCRKFEKSTPKMQKSIPKRSNFEIKKLRQNNTQLRLDDVRNAERTRWVNQKIKHAKPAKPCRARYLLFTLSNLIKIDICDG